MKPIIEVEKLRLKFPGEAKLMFKDLSFSIHKGERVLLLGPSGCGKSTLLQVLAGIIPRSIEVPMKAEKLCLPSRTGYVFQDPESQFCMPYADEEIAFVLENLQVPKEKMKEKISMYLKMVGLGDIPEHTRIEALSGGQKQRLAIASTLALEPEVLLLDEPTAMLDPAGTNQVWSTLQNVKEHQTLIIVEHKIEQVLDLVERIIVLDQHSEIIVDAPKDEVLKSCLPLLRSHGIWYPGVWDEYLQKSIKQTSAFIGKDPILTIKGLEVYRKKQVMVTVKEVTICPGEWIALVGENGAGKSTLLLGIMQLLKTTGVLEVFGNRIKPKADLSAEMAYVFQNPEFQFVTHTVYDELAHSLRLERIHESEIEERVYNMLTTFSLLEHRHKHPYQLSMGQKRRLSVASSIMNRQKILLLDEPTFGQDSKNTFELLELLNKEKEHGATILMITHDERIVENFATRTWTMKDGKLISDEVTMKKKLLHI